MYSGSMQAVPERIMSNALKEYDGKVSIGGRTSTNLLLPLTLIVLLKKRRNSELEDLVKVSTNSI